MNQIAFKLSQGQVLEMMGLQEGAMPPIAWLLIQHESQGASRGEFAKAMGVDEAALKELEQHVTQAQGDESTEIWQRGIVALKASGLGAAHRLAVGWDEIEAMALDKLGNQLANMRTDGKPEEMLAIATAANKAIRRSRGEGQRGSAMPGILVKPGESGAEVEMASGDLGTITLRFSPKIQEQLTSATRVIEGHANKESVAGAHVANLQMIRLKEARALVEESVEQNSELDPPTDQFGLGDLFETGSE